MNGVSAQGNSSHRSYIDTADAAINTLISRPDKNLSSFALILNDLLNDNRSLRLDCVYSTFIPVLPII